MRRLLNAWNEPRLGIRDILKNSSNPSAKFWLKWFDREFNKVGSVTKP